MPGPEVYDGLKVPIKAWTKGVEFEAEARAQIMNLSSLQFIHNHIAVMPDVHAGIGATVGSVIATIGVIIPAAVGVDIGCGCVAVRTKLKSWQLPDDLKPLRFAIEERVPHGRTDNGQRNDKGAWPLVPMSVESGFAGTLYPEYREIIQKHPKIEHTRAMGQLGTLGTGNHFIEVCLDEDQSVWIMLHSGSRGPGNAIGSYFIQLARKDMERYFINLPDRDLAYLPQGTQHYDDYRQAVAWAQKYARVNRELMLQAVLDAFDAVGLPASNPDEVAINCHHNFVSEEHHFGKRCLVTRKGAVRALSGEMAIIPGSMGTRSYIVSGKGNKDSFNSCSHGAGRRMSRTKARATFTVEDHIRATVGIECKKDESVLDETPGAYKDVDAVMEAQRDLVDVRYVLKAVLCVKG